MGISTYQIDNVIKAYNKQSRLKFRLDAKATSLDKFKDVVTLSGNEVLNQRHTRKSLTICWMFY